MPVTPTGRYTVLNGRFRLRNPGSGPQPRPDGDTVRFVLDDPERAFALPRFSERAPRVSAAGVVSLRLETIDALETHYPISGGVEGAPAEVRQPAEPAEAARDRLVALLGFKRVRFDANGAVAQAARDEAPGHVLASGVEANGRVVAYVYAGASARPDGERVRLEADEMQRSVNVALLRQGLAYATLYETQPFELVLRARAIAAKARRAKAGVFGAEDVGVRRRRAIQGLPALERLVMLPKLFRRLATYFAQTEGALEGFDAWVRADPQRDDRLLLPSGEPGHLHDLYEVRAGKLGLRFQPEDALFLES